MDQVLLMPTVLSALAFKPLDDQSIDCHEVLRVLLKMLPAGASYARTDVIGLGYTVVKDTRGRLWWTEGQFELPDYANAGRYRTRVAKEGIDGYRT